MSYILGRFIFNVPINIRSMPFGIELPDHSPDPTSGWSAFFLPVDESDGKEDKVILGYVSVVHPEGPQFQKGDPVSIYRGGKCIGAGLVITPSAPYSKLVQGKDSPIHGRGIFALQDFKAGDILQGVESKTPSRGFNYSCNPNIRVMKRSETQPGERPTPLAKLILRDVKAGEELLVPLPSSEFPCKCLSCGGSYVPTPQEKVLHNSTFNFGGSYVLGT